MIGAGVCLIAIGPVWLKSLNGSSLDWIGSSAVQLWFRQHGPVFAISLFGAALVAGLALVVFGVWKLARERNR